MSFDFPQKPQPRRGGKGGIFMFLIIGAAFLFIVSSMSGRGGQSGNGGQDGEKPASDLEFKGLPESVVNEESDRQKYGQRSEQMENSDRRNQSRPMPQSSSVPKDGWSIQEVGSKNKSSSNGSAEKKKTTKDGWSIEEVDGKKKSSTPKFEASNKSGSGKEVLGDNSSNDGWSVEDVDTSKKTVVKFENA
jgi:hypothetical protein